MTSAIDLVDGATTTYIGAAMDEGTYSLFRFEVTCEPQDLEISFRLADDVDGDVDGDARETAATDGAWATAPSEQEVSPALPQYPHEEACRPT